MADFSSIAAVSTSLVRFLTLCFEEQQPISAGVTSTNETSVFLVRTEDLIMGDNLVLKGTLLEPVINLPAALEFN